MTNPPYEHPYEEIMAWAKEEFENGNRVKASRIQKAAEKMKEKHEAEERKRFKDMYTKYF